MLEHMVFSSRCMGPRSRNLHHHLASTATSKLHTRNGNAVPLISAPSNIQRNTSRRSARLCFRLCLAASTHTRPAATLRLQSTLRHDPAVNKSPTAGTSGGLGAPSSQTRSLFSLLVTRSDPLGRGAAAAAWAQAARCPSGVMY